MAPVTKLMALPAEMLTAIAEQVDDPHDLLALRLVCKEVSAAAFEAFTTAFFTKRSHIYSCHGLQTLVDISAQPHLVKKLQEVELVCVRLNKERYQPHHTRIRYLVPPMTVPSGQEIPKVEQKGADVRQAWDEESERVREKGKDCFTHVFSNLSRLGVAPAVTLTLDVDETASCFGFGSLQRMLGPLVEENDFQEGPHEELVTAVLSSIVTTAYPVQQLALCKGARNAGLNETSFNLGHNTVARAAAPFAHLRSLALWVDADDFEPVNTETAEDIARLFGSATALEKLTVTSTQAEGYATANWYPALEQLARGFATNALKNVDLRCPATILRGYTDFLEVFKHTIKSLTLIDAMVDEDECWSTMFLWLVENVELEHLRLQGLQKDGGAVLLNEGKPVDCVFEGAAAVREGLTELARAPEYEDVEDEEDEDGPFMNGEFGYQGDAVLDIDDDDEIYD
ncbi:hypothetical protein LTR36_008316 [Oleoguttula mirabilis]|uniref:F-box domain-containing protein n=1 Tax=Oleoguttula mirabilis TaxID=1507867 RepID=A0AAV9J8C2_9PEZI|nr:hypothetical protein LTR36_008316 [Oleoguttula mirabilis]